MTQTRVLGLFAKLPEAGRVKTRLAAATSPEWAAEVARACLLDMIQRLAEVPAHRVLAYTPTDARPYFDAVAGPGFSLVPQAEGDLGKRMHTFFSQQLAQGAEPVVLLGTDSPTLPIGYIIEAFDRLEEVDVVLGPALDGGYYLVGCGRDLPPIFADIPWSTPEVLSATVARLSQTQHRLAVLPPWYDVDTHADWLMLKGHLAALRRAGIDRCVPHVEALVADG